MAMENKRIIQLSTERTNLTSGDYVMVDSDADGSAKYRLDRLKETDTTLSVSGKAADAAATGQAISDEAEARANADNELGDDIDDLKSAMSDAETAIEQLDEQKADSNRSYDNMTVGTAENVLSNKYALESVPYHFRKTGGDASVGSRLKEKIVSGTVAWNQLFKPNKSTFVYNGVTFTNNNDGTFSVSGTATADGSTGLAYAIAFQQNHKYLLRANGASSTLQLYDGYGSDGYDTGNGKIINWNRASADGYVYVKVINGTVYNTTITPQLFDLTQMFGTDIADYIYALEQATTGAGVALFRKLFPKQYYPYDAGSLQSVSGLVSHDEVGFNQWDEEWESGNIDSSGQPSTYSQYFRTKNFIPVISGANYYQYSETDDLIYRYFYDANKSYIGIFQSSKNFTFTVPVGACFMKFVNIDRKTYNHDICINLSDPSKNGTYEPYVKHSYPLDSSLTLRGIPKLVDNKIKFDGDWYESEGKKTKRYTECDLGTLNWVEVSGYSNTFKATVPYYTNNENMLCAKYLPTLYSKTVSEMEDKTFKGYVNASEKTLYIKDATYSTASEFKTAMNGVGMIIPLDTPIEETAQPYTNPQRCFEGGTEEYVTTGIVPVGHETEYFEDVVAKVDGLPWDLSMIAPIDNGTTATRAYTTGQYFLHNDQFCKAKTDIASGATFTLNTNYEVTTVAAELYTALH